MQKRYRLILILLIMAICFVFMLPSIRWYFLVPQQDPINQARALGTREQIRRYASAEANLDLINLWTSAQNGADLPSELNFLIPIARKNYKDARQPVPRKMDAQAVTNSFSSPQSAREAIEAHHRNKILSLKDLQRNAVQLGLDLSGGLSIVLQADTDALAERLGRSVTDADRDEALESALEVLNGRIDRFGLTEPVIRRQGSDQIYVEIPGTADPERINDIIMGRGSLSFHIVDTEAANTFNSAFISRYNSNPALTFGPDGELLDSYLVPSDVVVRGVYDRDPYGLEVQRQTGGVLEYTAVRREIGLDGTHIRDVRVDRDPITGGPLVIFSLTPEGGDIFFTLTAANVQRPMAIVLEDRVRSIATIQQAIRDNVSISGFGMEEANNIAVILRTAALPVELEVINQQSIGATLGADTIKQGLTALLYGLAAVMIFLILWYRSAGINAVIAQLLNFYIMFSILSAFNFTITLPSIAGFILTIGMATDANVIIFERMKEELRSGKGRKAAIEAGFAKAFWAIMDSNITTFIAALFLSQLGSGPVRGFAVCLAIGVFSSVFTSLFVSRLIFDFGTDVLRSRRLSVSWFTKQVKVG